MVSLKAGHNRFQFLKNTCLKIDLPFLLLNVSRNYWNLLIKTEGLYIISVQKWISSSLSSMVVKRSFRCYSDFLFLRNIPELDWSRQCTWWAMGPWSKRWSLLVGIITVKELVLPLPCLNINQRASSAVICYQQLFGTFSGSRALFFLQGDARTGWE